MPSPLPEAELTAQSIAAAKDYADTVLKAPLSQVGGILSDTIGYWRLKNQIRLLLKAREFVENKGIIPEAVLPNIFVPIMEDGSQVDDEKLSDMFASLLTSHLDPNLRKSVHPSFTKILSQLSPIDAHVLKEFRKHTSYKEARDLGLRGSAFDINFLSDLCEIDKDEAYLTCINLRRLGLLRHMGAEIPEGHPIPSVFEDDRDHQKFRITEFGIAFCDVCGCAEW